MCRIAGMFQKNLQLNEIQSFVEEMCLLQKHGGPDDGGIFASAENHLVLGNRRLALLDLTPDGHMPMQYQKRYYITYNGEIYNFRELKIELQSLGHDFQNNTDTEVILAAFAQWGTLSFSRLNGMFAFALWDDQEKELFLVRDAVGIKPLYYVAQKGSLVFASEIKAFSPIKWLSSQSENWPVYLLAYGHLPEPITTLKEVKPLPKGCFLKYKLSTESFTIQSFAHYSFSNKIIDAALAYSQIKISLENSVQSQLLADAPIGVFLSGGLDSGILASIATKYKQNSLNTLSIYFEEEAYSEKKYQDLLVNQLNCAHHQFLLQEQEFNHSFIDILNSMDLPSCDGVNTWFISKYAASNGLKAVLSGLGGDELFGGYPSFNRIKASILLQHMPDILTSLGKKSKSKRLNRMAYLRMDGIKGLYLFLRGHFSPNEIARQLGTYENEVWDILNQQPNLMDTSILDDKNQASWMEFNLYMQNQLLRDSDVMSMNHGVEIRVPFLDDGVIRLANQIDPQIKYQGPRSKQFLINCFKKELPSGIWDRPKMGFSFPFAKWLASSDFVKDVMNNNKEISKDNYSKFLNSKLHWSHLMSLIILNYRKVI